MNILKKLFSLIFGQKDEPKKIETLVITQQPTFTSSKKYTGDLKPMSKQPKVEAVVEQKPKPKRKNNYRAKQKKQKKNNENI